MSLGALRWTALVWCLAGGWAAQAQEELAPPDVTAEVPEVFQPGRWQFDRPGVWVTPSLGLVTGWNDNLRLSAGPTVSSRFWTWQPGLLVQWPMSSEHRVAFNLASELTRQWDSPADSATQTELTFDGAHLLAEQTALAWRAAAQDGHDLVQAALAEAAHPAADHFRAQSLGAVLRRDVGEADAFRSELEWNQSTKHYLNHREATRWADQGSRQWTLRGLQRWQPGLRAGLEWRDLQLRYPDNPQALDNHEQRWLGVLLWEPDADGEVARRSGPVGDLASQPPRASGWQVAAWVAHLRLGWQRKRYLHNELVPRPTWLGKTLEADGSWQLAPDHLIGVSVLRAAADAPGDGADDVLQTRGQLSWTARWTPLTTVTFSGSRTLLNYQGGSLAREERLRSLDGMLRHDLSRQCQLGLSLGWAERQSPLTSQRYVRHLHALSLTLAL